MVDDARREYAVPRYRDPEKTARIVAARRRGERLEDIAAREGVSRQRVWLICRDAGLTARSPTAPPPNPCACCGKLLRDRSAVYCSRKCAGAADAAGKHFYERRRDGGASWREIAEAGVPDWCLDRPQPGRRVEAARIAAQRYAKARGLPWPLPNLATSERIARRDEERAAEIREIVDHERRVLALLDELPKDRTITKPEAERFLVELYRTGMRFTHIAERTNCSAHYVERAVRRLAPDLIRPRAGRGKKMPPRSPLLDLRELRNVWRAEELRRQRDRQDARMLGAWHSGASLGDIARAENISRDAVWKRITGASERSTARTAPIAPPRPPTEQTS